MTPARRTTSANASFSERRTRISLSAHTGATARQIGQELGVEPSTVATVIQRLGVAEGFDLRIRYPQLCDLEWFQNQLNLGRDFTAIADKLGCARSTVWLNANRLGLHQPPRRT